MSLAAARTDRTAARTWLAGLVPAVVALCVLHVWIVDDAFITLRQVQQLLHGNGLVWNAGERVQAYTHPLWALLMIPVFALTGEGFWSLSALSLLVTLAAFTVAARALAARGLQWRAVVFLLLVLPSKALFDYTSSGLENCLTHLLVAATWAHVWTTSERDPIEPPAARRRLAGLALLVALTYLNRADTSLLVLPALLLGVSRTWPELRWRVFGPLALGLAPVAAWTVWSLLYYGSLVPNTAVAKILGARLTAGERLESGLFYALDSLLRDPYTLLFTGAAIVLLWRRRSAATTAAATGVAAYLLYVALVGAAGTHMSGRFYSAPFWLAAFALVRAGDAQATTAWRALALAALASLLVPSSPARATWQVGSSPYMQLVWHGLVDTRAYASAEGAGLLSYHRGVRMPDTAWFRAGLEFARSDARLHVGGLGEGGGDAIGFSAFAAGPDKYIVDRLGLADPLLARLPLPVDATLQRPGHVERELPAGYLESCATGENRIEDPDLRAYYEHLRLVARGPLWSWQRLRTIVAWNLGAYEHLLESYARRAGLRT